MKPIIKPALFLCGAIAICYIMLAFRPYNADTDGSIGDVKYSLLEPGSFLPDHPGWVLLDGRNADSYPIAALGIKKLPDARGLFIRGMNAGRTDGKGDPDSGTRGMGDFQTDRVKDHNHSINGACQQALGGKGFNGVGLESDSKDCNPKSRSYQTSGITDNTITSTETRPKNIALYVYVKVTR